MESQLAKGDEHETTTAETNPQELKLLEEVSIHNEIHRNESSEDENPHHDQVFYDASDELKDFEKPEPITVQIRNGREITIHYESTELQKRRRCLW